MPGTFADLIAIFLRLINITIPVVAGLALLAFLWGIARFVFRVGGDEKAVEEGKSLMVWGLAGLFVLVSIWGIIGFFYSDFGFGTDLVIPLLPGGLP